MEPSAIVRTSKFLSLILRHNPDKIGLVLDEHGWAEVDELLAKINRFGFSLDRAGLEEVVAQNNKQRFTFNADGQKIRASQGHSIPVDLELQPLSPPEVLYHGSASRFLSSILEKGLLPGSRTHVHLSKDMETARAVGKRHGSPVIFQVQARQMEAEGYPFFLSANGIWLTATVSPRFLTLLENNKQEPAENDAALLLPLPSGTQVITRIDYRDSSGEIACLAGAIGSILQAPETPSGNYLIRLVNGIEASFPRRHLTVRKLVTAQDMQAVGAEILSKIDLFPYVIYRCVVGSRAYGLAHENSDTDWRGFYLPPADLHWSLFGVPEQLEKPVTDECYWELQKFIQLALRANPNVLECLYTPLVETVTPLAQELLDQRDIFLTRLVFQTYNGYVISQFKKLEQDLRARGEIRWKHAMHLIRLLLCGITILRDGFMMISVDAYRDQLLAIKNGERQWEQVNEWRLRLHKEFEDAYQETRLPVQPDYRRANAFLIHARQAMLKP
jgi:uncharacterized protein